MSNVARIKSFNDFAIEVTVSAKTGKLLFSTLDICNAVGYSKISSLDYHIKGTKRDIKLDGQRYLDINGIKYLAKKAYRTPLVSEFAEWAIELVKEAEAEKKFVKEPEVKKVLKPAPTKDLYSVKEVAVKLGMDSKELGDWLVGSSCAFRYTSNNALAWEPWFILDGFGARPVIVDGQGTRTSNISKFTPKGIEYVKNRLESEREANVLAFAKKTSFERERQEQKLLEAEMDKLIRSVFKKYVYEEGYSKAFSSVTEYRLLESELLNGVREAVALIKLKG